MRSSMTGASGFLVGSWEATSFGDRKAPGPALAMTSSRSSSMADLRTMGRTEALASCMANKFASSSETWVGVIWVSPVESIVLFSLVGISEFGKCETLKKEAKVGEFEDMDMTSAQSGVINGVLSQPLSSWVPIPPVQQVPTT